jgi:hypothetical protein
MLETIDWADAGCTACSTAQTPCQVSMRLRVESPSLAAHRSADQFFSTSTKLINLS